MTAQHEAGTLPKGPPTGPGARNIEHTFGRFYVVSKLASGGMATVYLARAQGAAGIEKLVALKRIHPHLAEDPRFVDMFLDEARIASRLTHPNVCSVFEFGEVGGEYYLAMEYLVGEPLSVVFRAIAPRPEIFASQRFFPIAARIAADACEGLHAAHELRDARGRLLHVVHRDVSPQNLFVTYDGIVRVMDFGIATATNRVHETAVGDFKGKIAYMSPEQLLGEKADRRADIWALGVVLWELIAGKRLFHTEGGEVQLIQVVAHEPIPRLRDVRPDTPPELDAVVARALERNRDNRYATARDMGRDLVRLLAQEPVGAADVAEVMESIFPGTRARKLGALDLARRTSEDEPTRAPGDDTGVQIIIRPWRPWRKWIIAGVVIALLSVGGGLAALMKARRPRTVPPVPTATRSAVASVETGTPPADVVHEPPTPALPPPDPAAPPDTGDAPMPPASAEPRVHRRPSGSGSVTIVTAGGWGYVYENGNKLGTTPLIVSLSAGRHTLEVRPFGRAPGERRTVTVRSGGAHSVLVPLTPPSAPPTPTQTNDDDDSPTEAP